MTTTKPRKKWGDPGSKITRATSASLFSAGKQHVVVVTVYPDGLIGLRLLRHRTEEYVDAADIYRQAVMTRVAAERAAKKAKKKKK